MDEEKKVLSVGYAATKVFAACNVLGGVRGSLHEIMSATDDVILRNALQNIIRFYDDNDTELRNCVDELREAIRKEDHNG